MAHDNIGGAEPSTVTFQVATFTHDRGSTTEHQEILILGGQESSLALAAIRDAAPASTNWGLVVRQVGYVAPSTTAGVNSSLVAIAAAYLSSAAAPANSSALNVRVVGGASSAADFLIRPVLSSTAADNPVQVSGNSTVHLGSIAAGLISSAAPAAGSSGLIVWPVGYSTTVSVANQVSAAIVQPLSSGTPAHGSSAVLVRQVTSSLQSITAIVAPGNSTELVSLISSAAAGKWIFAFSLTSTHATPSTFIFMTASTTHLWGVGFGSGSSGVTGANLAVSPPGALFSVPAGEPLQAVLQSGSTGSVRISLSWFT